MKNPQHKEENQQQTQPTCDARSGNQTQAIEVGGECCAPFKSRIEHNYRYKFNNLLYTCTCMLTFRNLNYC